MRNREPVSFRINYVFDKVRGYYISSKEGVLDIITKASMLYDSKGELVNYILINLDNTEKLIARTRIEEFENIFSLVGNYAKVGYAKFDLISCEGKATNQVYNGRFHYPGLRMDAGCNQILGHGFQRRNTGRNSTACFRAFL